MSIKTDDKYIPSRARAGEVLNLFSMGFLQQPFQISPLLTLTAQSEQASSPRVQAASWRLLITEQQRNPST